MTNNFPQIALVYNRRHKASSKTKATLEVRIAHAYKQKYISTGIQLYPNQWKKGRVTNCPDALQLNQVIDKLLADIRQVILDMIENNSIDIFAIPTKLKSLKEERISFIDYCNRRATVRKYGKSKDTQTRYERFIRLFAEWGKIVHFEDICESSIIDYDHYLEEKHMKANSKWYNYHRFLNSFIMDAVDEGLLSKNPYKWVNINKGKDTYGLERCLTPDEFYKLKNSKMPTGHLERVKDIFVFQTYTCLSYADLLHFDPSSIDIIESMKVYTGKRHKTGKPFTIPLLSTALAILSKYNNKLPIISNVKYNEYLKVVAQSAGIDKPISSHWARHTGATLLLNEGVDMRIVSKICGHSSIKMTEQVYAKLLDETVVKAMKGIKI